ncbi:serine/threonine-protein kinase 31-like [Stylophora pistillata]|uniref:serine/threonine-protein kinase 31-like n=1 Tax=Stylophora pistillata TaxID=50429 RepID=UPI000C04D48D|nr:serine/threonine-protein kinase 31-like [Stylophora pistillata]
MLYNLSIGKLLTIQLKEPRRALDVACAVELRDNSEVGVGNIAEELIKHGLVTSTSAGQDGPPPLSPRTSLSEAISKEMEELTKENQSLRNRIKLYKEGEKAVDELRKYYSAQAAKHKENMEQAVSHKVLDLVSKVHDLKAMRDATPANGKTSEMIMEAVDLTRNDRIDLKSIKSLQQVLESEKNLEKAQDNLRHCKDKEELLSADLIPKRDEAKQMFVDSIELFCKEVDLLPLQEREKHLQNVLGQLQDQGDSSNTKCDLAVEEAVQAYEDWVERNHQDMADVRQKVHHCTNDLVTALSNLQLALVVLQKDSEAVSTSVVFDDMDTMMNALSSAIQEEMDKSKVSEDKEAQQIVDRTVKALISELSKEFQDVRELRDNLVINYRTLQADMGKWLETKPDIKKAIEIKRIIKTLRSRLRHRLADKKDLEEGDEPETSEELQKVENEISEIYLKLHLSFEDESNFLADVGKATSHHFPELPIAHPELGISEFLASNGLVKPGRELEHYPHHDCVPSVSHDKCSVVKTEFAGRPCILKELSVDREVGDIEILKRNAVNFSSVKNPYLMQLDAFFVKVHCNTENSLDSLP